MAGRLAAATCRWLLLVADLIMVAEHGTVGPLATIVRGLRTVEDNQTAPVPPEEYSALSWTKESHWRTHTRRL